MLSNEPASQRCELCAAADLLAVLDARLIDHLDVDASRTFVLYREAVLDLRVTNGTLGAARSFTVAVQGFAHQVTDPNPTAVITALCDELLSGTTIDSR